MLKKASNKDPIVYSSYTTSTSTTESIAHSTGDSECMTFGNYGWQDLASRSNVGSEFSVSRKSLDYLPSDLVRVHGSNTSELPFRDCRFIPSSIGLQPTLSSSDLRALGATAFSQMKPAQPEFQILNSVFELKDIPGMLKSRFNSGNRLKDIGDFHLAVQFGWLPLLSDVRNFVNLQRTGQAKIEQLMRDNGRPVRRRRTLLDETTISDPIVTQSNSAMLPSLASSSYEGVATRREWTIVTKKVWASARFRYWLPGGPQTVEWKSRLLRRLYGARPTPSVIYNMIPWSWLADYFSNLGDVIENLDTGVADSLAADYFYIMGRDDTLRVVEVTGKVRPKPAQVGQLVTCSAIRRQSLKRRIKGNPFGFALDLDLSAKQWSILGALGLSRLG